MTPEERALFQQTVHDINAAYAARGDRPLPHWSARLRIKRIHSTPSVWEMTWSFAGPDGRATFQLVEVDGEPAIRWRRIGGHEISQAP